MLELLQNLDGSLLLWIQSVRFDLLDPLVCFYTTLGNTGMLWIVVSVLLLFSGKTRKAGILGLAALLLGFICTNLTIKPLVERARPWLTLEGLTPLVNEKDPHSFPSGHSTSAFAAGVAWALCVQKKWLRVLAVGAAACMALSRLYVGVHYPSDVLCGSLIGALCGWSVWKVWNRNEDKLSKR